MTNTTIRLEVLTFDGCPHAQPALDLAHEVAQVFGDVEVIPVTVRDEAHARELGFVGSPSFRVDGRDIEDRTTEQGALTCRVYEGGAGTPPQWLLEAAILRARRPRGLLFLCVANSARSQIGEGVARALAPRDVTVWSAGSRPTQVRPEAIAVLQEIGIDISGHHSKPVTDIPADQVDTVITLCGEEECPVFLGKAARLHWGLPDPAGVTGDEQARLDAFRAARDELRRRLSVVFDK